MTNDQETGGVTVSSPPIGRALAGIARTQGTKIAAVGLAGLAVGLHGAAVGLHTAAERTVRYAHRLARAAAAEVLEGISPERIDELIERAARERGVDPELLRQVVTDARTRRGANRAAGQ